MPSVGILSRPIQRLGTCIRLGPSRDPIKAIRSTRGASREQHRDIPDACVSILLHSTFCILHSASRLLVPIRLQGFHFFFFPFFFFLACFHARLLGDSPLCIHSLVAPTASTPGGVPPVSGFRPFGQKLHTSPRDIYMCKVPIRTPKSQPRTWRQPN